MKNNNEKREYWNKYYQEHKDKILTGQKKRAKEKRLKQKQYELENGIIKPKKHKRMTMAEIIANLNSEIYQLRAENNELRIKLSWLEFEKNTKIDASDIKCEDKSFDFIFSSK